jgi:hypothetical protein
MEKIEKNKNNLTTDCGHTFHTSCLLTNIAKNGFGCPYCRTLLAEKESDDESLPTLIDAEEYNWETEVNQIDLTETDAALAWNAEITPLLENVERREVETLDADLPDTHTIPTPREIVTKLQERGITMYHFVQAFLKDFVSYGNDEETFMRVDDELYEHINEIINYTVIIEE